MPKPTDLDAALRAATQAQPTALAITDAPNRAGIVGGEPQRLTWSEVGAAVDAVAAQLAELGAVAGTRVGIQLPNIVELPVAILACIRLGAVAVPFPIQHRLHELTNGIRDAEIDVVVSAARPDRPDLFSTLAEAARAADRTCAVGAFGGVDDQIGGEIASLALDTGQTLATAPVLSTDQVATICWTSGTTGLPKGVPRTHSMWLASGEFQVEQLTLGPDDRLLCPFPVVNMAGIGGMLVPWVLSGAQLHLHQPLDLQVFLGQIVAESITYTVAPPALLNMLLANEAMLAQVDLSSVRMIASGSAPLDPWMVEGWEARGIEIVNVFGSNEGAAMLSTRDSVADPTQRARAFPRPDRDGVDIKLVDLDSGREINEPGVIGELRFTGNTVFDGYLGSTGEEFDDDGWYRTGDLFEWVDGVTDATGTPQLLRFVDRAKDIIIRGGMNISAAELEALVSSHHAVTECAAVGYPDEIYGEKVGVFIAPAPDHELSLIDLTDHLRAAGVASYKFPERLELIDALPRNPVGKVIKPELRSRWAGTDA